MRGESRGRLRPAQLWGGLSAAALAFVAIRLWLLLDTGIFRGWNSDAAIFGLMGRDILLGRFEIFFWGQNYMGPLTSMVAAAWGAVLAPTGDARWPLALRLATMTTSFAALAIFARVFSTRTRSIGLAPSALLTAGPPFFFLLTVVAKGADMSLLFTALILMAALPVVERRSHSDARMLWVGLASGVGWWMNQGVVFIIGALALALWWQFARDAIGPQSGWKLRLYRYTIAVASVWLAWNLLATLFPIAEPLFDRAPIAAPFVAMIAAGALAHLDSLWRALSPQQRRSAVRAGSLALAGFLAGWSPVWLGAIAGWYDRTYSFPLSLIGPERVGDSIHRTLVEVTPRFAGVEWIPFLALPLLAFAIAGFIALTRTKSSEVLASVAALVTLAAFGHCVLTQYSARTVHYLAPALPFFLLLVCEGAAATWRSSRSLGRITVIALFALLLASWTHGLADLARRIYAQPDHSAIVRQIREEGYTVCYAGFWQAYHLRFIGNDTVKFIPYRSHDRTPGHTQEFEQIPGPRCHVSESYEVRPFATSGASERASR